MDVVAEWSKAVDLGSILFAGVGSNPTDIMFWLSTEGAWHFQSQYTLTCMYSKPSNLMTPMDASD